MPGPALYPTGNMPSCSLRNEECRVFFQEYEGEMGRQLTVKGKDGAELPPPCIFIEVILGLTRI